MKKVLFPLSIALIAALSVACDDDEDPAFDLPTIQVVTGSLEQRAGESIDVNASVVADAGSNGSWLRSMEKKPKM